MLLLLKSQYGRFEPGRKFGVVSLTTMKIKESKRQINQILNFII